MTILADKPNYNDDIVKLFTIATIFWGVVGFCTILGLVVLAWFGMRHWLRR